MGMLNVFRTLIIPFVQKSKSARGATLCVMPTTFEFGIVATTYLTRLTQPILNVGGFGSSTLALHFFIQALFSSLFLSSPLRRVRPLIRRSVVQLLLSCSIVSFSSSSAFLVSSHLSCGLPRFLQPCFSVPDLFGNLSSFILNACPAHGFHRRSRFLFL